MPLLDRSALLALLLHGPPLRVLVGTTAFIGRSRLRASLQGALPRSFEELQPANEDADAKHSGRARVT
jgi:hypothetical protein